MRALIKSNFKLTNDSIILTVPLIAFLSILGWYFNYATKSVDDIIKLVFSLVTLFIMFSGFLSAWLYMTKKTLALTKKSFGLEKNETFSRTKDLFYLLKMLPQGIGRLFLPILSMSVLYVVAYALLFTIALLVLNLDSSDFILVFSVNQLSYYIYILLPFIWVVCFITCLWIPEIVYTKKDALLSLKNSIFKVRTNIGNSIILYLFISLLVFTIILANVFSTKFPILYFFTLTYTYYFIVYIIVLLFRYYEKNFTDKG